MIIEYVAVLKKGVWMILQTSLSKGKIGWILKALDSVAKLPRRVPWVIARDPVRPEGLVLSR